MELVAKLDDLGKPAWIGLMVLGFVLFWPVGLGILAYLIWSGRMGCWKSAHNWRADAMRFGSGRSGGSWHGGRHWRSSGNAAFDEYREQTLKRLEEEQKEFTGFLEKLRMAKDKSEFDDFMAERGARPAPPRPVPPEPQAPNVPDTGPGGPEENPTG